MAAFPDKPLVVHFHNDFGLGAYNTVRALHHGATIPTCTVNGLGERAGNAPLHTTVMILKELYGITIPGFRYDMLWALRRKVEEFSGLPVGATEPIIGHNVFTPRDRHPHRGHHDPPRDLPGDRARIGRRAAALPVRQALGGDGDRGRAPAPRGRARRGRASRSTPKLVQLLLRLVKEVREKKAMVSQHLDGVRNYYAHLDRLGLTEEDLAGLRPGPRPRGD